ncbi:mitochondrial fission ELM1 family protein [Humitalea sp. 24SJ18S-53]|uniref:mitochondrial fission ELM1 family protein n=1 Tax=Humitalea sp. 24SJ18S-53 TaxID=3422307 RepID=UPI003D678705
MTQDAEAVWVLADPRAGTAAQALGLAERLGRPFRVLPLEWGPLAALPMPWPSLAGLTPAARALMVPPWPRLVISAGRRSAPVALWLGARGAKTVHAMRPGFGARSLDLMVVGQHDAVQPAENVFPILGAMHRMSPDRLATARQDWAVLGDLPGPRIGLLLGGPVRGVGMAPGAAAALATQAVAMGGSVLASTSRRTGDAAARAVADSLAPHPHRLFAWGDPGANPYAGILAWADAIIVSGDSVSMISEALATSAAIFIAPTGDAPRHARLAESLFAAGQARPLVTGSPAVPRQPLDETGRVAAELTRRSMVPA